MKKFWRKIVSTAFIGTLLLSFSSINDNEAYAASQPIKDTITLTVRYPDTVGEDERGKYGIEPTDYYTIEDMILNPRNKYSHRTGWSAITYECEFNQVKDKYGEWVTVSGWKELDSYNTVDSHVPHPASEDKIRQAVIQKYGEEMYQLALKHNAVFYYDPNTTVPSKFLNPNTPEGQQNLQFGYTKGLHSVYFKDTRYWNDGHIKCNRPGEKAYAYNNNEFFVTATFQTEWVDNEPEGSITGKTYWELERKDKSAPSVVAVHSEYKVPYEQHVGVRNIKHSVQLGSKSVTKNTDGSIGFDVNAQSVKNKNLTYSFSYEYTNKEIGWVCVAWDEEGNCSSYIWNSRPDWRAVQTFNISGSIPVDHRQLETEKWSKLDEVLKVKWIVGRQDTWKGTSKQSRTYYETWKRAEEVPSEFDLNTQTYLPILQGALTYEVELPSGKHKEGSFNPLRREWSHGYFFPADVDDSLKDDYRNRSEYSYEYAFPLQQSVMKNNGMQGNKRSFTVDFTTDLFLMSEHTGFIVGVPYAEAVKQSIISNSSLPSVDTYVRQGESKLESRYEQATGQNYRDNTLHTDLERIQRYYLPIDSSSTLLPGNTYTNHIVYKNMGLSDAVFEFDQTFSYQHYLFGTPKDNAWIVEQVAKRSSLENVPASQIHRIYITSDQVKVIAKEQRKRTNNRVHEFRYSDRDFVDKIKSIVDLDL